ncbi:MAG: acetylpolyamine amidohydrolase [Micavibrio aeruginosavorus]|uniref:Acetylpolyamine amidohydrolase n=1 Tax=Micavibrio aeruginosavorus TaxID=349221 RepID=A0A2W5MSH4_9BACT|nr:MAG: acetylpolyamine amidohydrolase [Micavibrio aeruginosavorus]
MKTVYSEKHTLHHPGLELMEGRFVENFEKPERVFFVRDQILHRGFSEIIAPEEFPADIFSRVHDPRYVAFLKEGYRRWEEQGESHLMLPSVFNLQNFDAPEPRALYGQMGYYIADGAAPLTETTWEAISHSAFCALTGQKMISNGEKTAFALCRPPGHHASKRLAAGYCYLNNAAIAAQGFLESGAKRVAVIDVDYHHGNGTQDIFYDRDDIMVISIHADPADDYPFYLGYADEKGIGKGEGYNINMPLPLGTDYTSWSKALDHALEKTFAYKPDAVIVSLGVDTFEKDPISKFKLQHDDYTKMGDTLAKLNMPTLFVMEGGYAVEDIGINVANVLTGFLNR